MLDIEKMKKEVEKLDEVAEVMEMFGDDGEMPKEEDLIGEDGQPLRIKPRRDKLCKEFKETGRCRNLCCHVSDRNSKSCMR